jgi:hypothetical protein
MHDSYSEDKPLTVGEIVKTILVGLLMVGLASFILLFCGPQL